MRRKQQVGQEIELSVADARRLLATHHFAATTIEGAFERLGSVQFDPLRPLGCNHDLVLQARVPDYREGAWQELAYHRRKVYDGWDKQASLVRMRDWPHRRIYHVWLGEQWRTRVLDVFPDAVKTVLDELTERGPLAASQFRFSVRRQEWQGSWYGPRLTKHVLRALWHTGQVATHSRRANQHVYDLAERVVPEELLRAPEVPADESVKWLVELRHQATGLLQPAGNAYEVWSLPLKAAVRREVIGALVREGRLVPVLVDGRLYHTTLAVLAKLDDHLLPATEMRFVAPLDQLLWDRRAAQSLFGFDYAWEVYKPVKQRRWGYYVLPVFFNHRFVGRFDGQLKDGTLLVNRWWWEDDVEPNGAVLSALEQATVRFMRYLRARSVRVARRVDARAASALKAAANSQVQ